MKLRVQAILKNGLIGREFFADSQEDADWLRQLLISVPAITEVRILDDDVVRQRVQDCIGNKAPGYFLGTFYHQLDTWLTNWILNRL